MQKKTKIAGLYVATLRAISIIHQQNHWTAKGSDFYGNHLLFERIYKSSVENIDSAAEKFMGLFGPEFLSYEFQSDILSKLLLTYKSLSKDHLELSLAVERDFAKLSKDVYNYFEAEGELTLGLDDMIMAIANEREEAIYLLQQALNYYPSIKKDSK